MQTSQKIIEKVKTKGWTLNKEVAEVIHFARMKQMVIEFVVKGSIEKISLKTEGIRRTKDHQVVTRQLTKSFGVTADKRALGRSFNTHPHGWD